ncbi:MAG: DUF2141 domain-containing protein [Terracidiphilus sp.]|jgi:uncharacterized protein (DUF2141 family)
MSKKRFFRISFFLLLLASALMAGTLHAQAVSTLTVHVTGIRNANGNIRLSLYRDSNFVQTLEVEIDPKTMTAVAVFNKLPQGTYTVQLFHDENRNGKMDTNLFGMPVEGYGFSNNPKKRMGKPGFDETNFQVNQPECSIEIKMIYW